MLFGGLTELSQIRAQDPFIVAGQAMMRNGMRRSGVSLGQLGNVIFRRAEFEVGLLGGDVNH